MSSEAAQGPAPVVRPALPDDVSLVLTMIRELADYERALHEVHATEKQLQATLFGGQPTAFCHIAEVDGEVAGYAWWFLSFSTWLGSHGLYLEDLYVRPQLRGRQVGAALLRELATICVDRGYRRLEWWVLDWNVDARGFYTSLGAEALTEWIPYRVTGQALGRLAGGEWSGPRSTRDASTTRGAT